MQGFLVGLVVSLLATSGMAALSLTIRSGRPKALEGEAGVITPERATAVVTVLVGLVMMAAGTAMIWNDVQRGTTAGRDVMFGFALFMGLVIAVFMSPSLTDVHEVRWSHSGIEGPSRMFGPTLGLRRESLRWPDLARTGRTATGYWYIESADGRRVYWSYLYKGYGRLTEALQNHCPGLTLPRGMA